MGLFDFWSRTPQGVRGLKSAKYGMAPAGAGSHPARGAWIEIGPSARWSPRLPVAPRKGCVD